jgi:hypothetical protein
MLWIPPPKKSHFSNERAMRIPRPDMHIPAPINSLVLDESPSNIFGPNTQELQNMKNMILTLQLDLQDERCKRECLEEKVRKFEGNITQKSHRTSERKWRLSDMRVPDKEIPPNQIFLPAWNTTKDVDEKIGELRSDFDLRLRSFE